LEQDHGDLQLARYWYQQGIATGHPDTAPKLMVSLGILEHGQGDLVRSRHWYQRAISTGHSYAAATAMFNLGTLEGEQGHLDQARHWYQLAISTGQPRVVDLAQQQLRDLDRHEDERLRGERFGQYRYLAYADGDLMDRREENLDPSDTDVLKQAPDGNDDGPIS
jgi:TPR repeat protein